MNAQTLVLLDLALKGTAVLLLGITINRLLSRASAAHRSLAWLAAFGVLLLLPLAVFIEPLWSVPVVTASKGAPPHAPIPIVVESKADRPVEILMARPAVRSTPPWTMGEVLALLYFAGVALIITFRLIGSWQLRRLRNHAQRADARLLELIAAQHEACGIRRPITTLVSARISVPMTWGTARPVLMLPSSCSHWSDADLRSALQHELAHICHFDAARRWLATCVSALWWPHPLIWIASKAWRLEQERACDDAVMRSGADAGRYASQLLAAARAVRLGSFQSAAALVMAVPSGLERRLRAVTDAGVHRSSSNATSRAVASCAFAVAIALCAAVAANSDEGTGDTRQIIVRTKFLEFAVDSSTPVHPALARALSGTPVTLSAAEMDELMRRVAQQKGVNIMSAPTVTTRCGQQATVEVVREFIYPTEFEKGAPNESQAKDSAGVMTPAHVEMMPVGVMAEVMPKLIADGSVECAPLTARVNEFDGFVLCDAGDLERDAKGVWRIKEGRRLPGGRRVITGGKESDGKPWRRITQDEISAAAKKLALKDGQVSAPVFSTHEWTGNVKLKPGEWQVSTLVFKRGDKALHENRRLWCFVSAEEVKAPAATAATPPTAPAEKTTLQKARRIVLPQVEFRDASIAEAVEFLRTKSRDLDPDRQGINIILQTDTPSTAEITLSLRDVPLNEAVRYVSELSGMQSVFEEHAVIIRPFGEPEGMEQYTRVYPVPEAFMSPNTDARKWLEDQAVVFREGAAASLDRHAWKLTVKNVPQELRKVEAILQRQGIRTEPPKPAIVQRAERIIFPVVAFKNATLTEAVEFFRAKSRALDPDKKGVNIVLNGGAEKSDARLTLDLKNIPLREALRYVAQLAALHLVASEDSFVIAPWVPPAR